MDTTSTDTTNIANDTSVNGSNIVGGVERHIWYLTGINVLIERHALAGMISYMKYFKGLVLGRHMVDSMPVDVSIHTDQDVDAITSALSIPSLYTRIYLELTNKVSYSYLKNYLSLIPGDWIIDYDVFPSAIIQRISLYDPDKCISFGVLDYLRSYSYFTFCQRTGIFRLCKSLLYDNI